MARKAKEAGEEADRLIAENAKNKANTDDPPVSDEQAFTLDDEPAPDDNPQGDDLSFLDDEPPPRDDDKDYKHMYEVLQGKYNAENKRLGDFNSQLLSQVEELKAQVASIKEGGVGPEMDIDAEIESLKAEYPRLYKGFLALARKEAGVATKKTEERVDGIVQHTIAGDQEKYLAALTEKIPLWQKINAHPTFNKWLQAVDVFSGKTKFALLRSAYDRLDVNASVAFFEDFMKEKGIRNQSARSSDDESIAPNTSGIRADDKSDRTGTLTRADIAKHFEGRRKGLYTPEECAKFDKRMHKQISEGKLK